MHLSPTDTDSGRLRESEFHMILGIIGVIALFLLGWQVFVGVPAFLRRREQAKEAQSDWLTGEGFKDSPE